LELELRHLRYFVAVAEELHFGKAAERLGIAQPPLSQQIQRIERDLGVQLFDRSKRQVRLTAAGRTLLEQARPVIALAEQATVATREAGAGRRGSLAIGFVGSATYRALPAVIRRYRDQFPDVSLQLRESTTAEQVEALSNRTIQAGFVRPPVTEAGLVLETILQEGLAVALPEGHQLAVSAEIAPGDLAGETLVMFPREQGPGFYDQIIALCRVAGFSPQIGQTATQMQTIVALVAAGLGIAIVPESVADLRRPGVVYRPLEGTYAPVELALVWREDDNSPALARFLEVARRWERR
jgi:DNA-binding transcriptional LysR family regulator